MTDSIFNNMPQAGIQYVKPKQVETPKQPVSAPSVSIEKSLPSLPAASTPAADKAEFSNNKKKQGPIKSIKSFISNIKKFFASASAYVKGGFKGIASGAVIGSVIYTFGAIINSVKSKAAQKANTEFKKIPNKPLAIIAAIAAFGANLWTASLNATEAKSDIDHRWTGHQQ